MMGASKSASHSFSKPFTAQFFSHFSSFFLSLALYNNNKSDCNGNLLTYICTVHTTEFTLSARTEYCETTYNHVFVLHFFFFSPHLFIASSLFISFSLYLPSLPLPLLYTSVLFLLYSSSSFYRSVLISTGDGCLNTLLTGGAPRWGRKETVVVVFK